MEVLTSFSSGDRQSESMNLGKMEVAVGLEPTKTSFAGWCLDHFGIATSENLHPESIPKPVPKMPSYRLYPYSSPRKLLKPYRPRSFDRFCRPLPYHLANALHGLTQKKRQAKNRKPTCHFPSGGGSGETAGANFDELEN